MHISELTVGLGFRYHLPNSGGRCTMKLRLLMIVVGVLMLLMATITGTALADSLVPDAVPELPDVACAHAAPLSEGYRQGDAPPMLCPV